MKLYAIVGKNVGSLPDYVAYVDCHKLGVYTNLKEAKLNLSKLKEHKDKFRIVKFTPED